MSDPIVRRGEQIDLDIRKQGKIYLDIEHPTVTGVKSYNQLEDKPIINDVVIQGNKVGPDYHLQDKMDTLTIQEVERIFYVGD